MSPSLPICKFALCKSVTVSISVSRFKVTVPDDPPPFKLVPAVTPSISPEPPPPPAPLTNPVDAVMWNIPVASSYVTSLVKLLFIDALE